VPSLFEQPAQGTAARESQPENRRNVVLFYLNMGNNENNYSVELIKQQLRSNNEDGCKRYAWLLIYAVPYPRFLSDDEPENRN
jgi:hypothetical protein